MQIFGKRKSAPADVFDEGWQLYARPTMLEPPGTVFRIDDTGRRYLVGSLDVQLQVGAEASARLERSMQARLAMFLRFLGLETLAAKAGFDRVERLTFDLVDAEREALSDVAIDEVLPAFIASLKYRVGNRYFLVRESLSCTSMVYTVTKELGLSLEAEATPAGHTAAGAAVSIGADGSRSYPRGFDQRLRVTFLPEEIKPVAASLSSDAPVLGRVAVHGSLAWRDDDDAT